jgi:3-hydroxymyristoyl/3-hydroxydecanoyl-(acyl carrier protein) dehydratase
MQAAEFIWAVPAEHPAFPGHFPGRPIVPGVVLLDQAILFAETLLGKQVDRWQVGNAKFLSPVGPAETLVFSLQPTPRGAIAFTVKSGERDVASGSLTPPAA